MLQKTRGIALNYIKFKETSIIIKIYTEIFGLQSYIVNNIRNKTSKKSLAFFQPLTLLDLVVYSKKNENKQEGIKRLSEYKTSIPFQSIPFDIKKISIAIFITEFIIKLSKEFNNNENNVFEFLHNSIFYLDKATKRFENFHIQFLIQLSDYIGFGITKERDIKDLRTNFLERENVDYLSGKILQLKLDAFDSNIKLKNKERKAILNLMLIYYSTHIDGFDIKSKSILNQIFNK